MSVRGTHVPEHLRLPIAGVTPPPTEKEGQRLFPTGNFRFYRPVYRDKTPPCNHACPTGEQIQKYLDHVKHDRYLDGYLTICRGQPDALGHRPGLLPPLRDRLQPGRARRADRHPRGGAVPRGFRPEARGQPGQAGPAPAERQDGGDRGLGSRRPRLRLPPAPQGLRQRHLRGPGQARGHAAGRHPRLAPARGDPRRRDRQAAGPGRHRDPLRRPGRRGRGPLWTSWPAATTRSSSPSARTSAAAWTPRAARPGA